MAKRKSKEQTVIAGAVAQQQEVRELKRKIAKLNRLPDDFRDCTGEDWEDFAECTGRREEMDKWNHGPMVCLAPLNIHELKILEKVHELVAFEVGEVEDIDWLAILEMVKEVNASWIYLPDEESEVINALNVLFSRFSYNVRAKGRLMSVRTGHPVGVVY